MANTIEQQRITCAIGALQTVTAIEKAVPILHAGPGCGMMVSRFFERATGYAGGNTAPCTNFSEKEVVFGGLDKLRENIKNTYRVLDTDLQVVLTGCTAAIVGDDIESVVSEFAEEDKPIVQVETAGFTSSNIVAHSKVVNAIIDQFVDKFYDRKKVKNKKLVNLFASIPYQDQFWKGNLFEFKYLLEGLGLEVNILFGPYSNGVAEWKTIPEANFNILVSPWFGKEIVKNLEKKYQQPYYEFPFLPIGANETTRFLQELLAFANEKGADLDEVKALAFIKREEKAYYAEIDSLATFLTEFRYGLPSFAHIIGDSSYVLGLSKFLLHEVGIVPKEVFVTDKTPKSQQGYIEEILKSTSDKKEIPLYFTPSGGEAQEKIREIQHPGRGLILGAGWDKYLAKEKDYDFLSIENPSPYRLVLTTGYVGFKGGLRLIEDIYDVVLSSYN
ncbi:hydrogenase [Sporanaerobium hydrogeniformans]|uniref:Hydrogenase n=1 Tax=Sporanaerobium hydrogeniformans TaxID=3072179 RepID=A0AC61DB83_9FIRM|nr:nitrogenase component 1 [Sporanaerobium hydrogeniformans]PHV70529.1 hydrogenase [Sporanaerobium hydrogeniformans]